MDASWRKPLCFLGPLVVLLLLGWSCGSDATTTVIFDPFIPVRGHTLDVNVFTTETNCTLQLSASEVSQTNGTELSWDFSQFLTVRVLVALNNAGLVTANVSCYPLSEPFSKSAAVTSDANVQFLWTASPSPAYENKPLEVNVDLLNQGGHPAFGLECSASAGTLTCKDGPQASGDEQKPCPVGDLFPQSNTSLSLAFAAITQDTNVTLNCKALNLPESVSSTFQILLKSDAKIEVDSQHKATEKAVAGSDFTVVTTIQNAGRAQADNLTCSLTFEEPEKLVAASISDSLSKCAAVLNSTTNATIGAVCAFGDLKSNEKSDVSLRFRVDPAVKSGSTAKFAWACQAAGLPKIEHPIEVATDVQANLFLVLPANSTIGDGSTALLFRMQNDGPSFVRDGRCNFTFPEGIAPETWSELKHVKCKHSDTHLDCSVAEIPPKGVEFSLNLKRNNRSLQHFVIDAVCNTTDPVSSFAGSFSASVGPSPSPAPHNPVVPPPDNSMMVVVTVIVAIGLLIVITIWWRKKQERSGWEATGPSPRSPSLNRFSDVELSVRSTEN